MPYYKSEIHKLHNQFTAQQIIRSVAAVMSCYCFQIVVVSLPVEFAWSKFSANFSNSHWDVHWVHPIINSGIHTWNEKIQCFHTPGIYDGYYVGVQDRVRSEVAPWKVSVMQALVVRTWLGEKCPAILFTKWCNTLKLPIKFFRCTWLV